MEAVVTIQFPRRLVDAAKVTGDELKIELAVHLYKERRLSIGHAREMAGLSLWEFRQILASRQISPHYDVDDLEDDISALRDLGQM